MSSGICIDANIDPLLESQFAAGRLYASISSRPGQSGRADGYILEGRELEVGPLTMADFGTRGTSLTVSHVDAVLLEEDQDWQAEARTRGMRRARDVIRMRELAFWLGRAWRAMLQDVFFSKTRAAMLMSTHVLRPVPTATV